MIPAELEEAEARPRPDTTAKTGRARIPSRWWVAAAVALGFLVRALYVVTADFPLNDGGMFYVMVRELQAAGYRLPAFTSYNGLHVPFAYSPFGFYVAGILDQLTPLGLFGVFRFLPLAVASLTIVAFYLLARSVLESRETVAASVFAYALLPSDFAWLIMGGGLTRSFGFLFAILALHRVWLLYTHRSWRHVPLAALFCALTVLSHLGTAPFVVFSIGVFFLARGRHRFGVAASLAVGVLTLLLTAPWWWTVVSTHGLEPFLAAQRSGAAGGYAGLRNLVVLVLRLGWGTTHESLFPVLLVLALLGLVRSLMTRRFLLPGWLALLVVVEHRALPLYSSLAIAMLAGTGVTEVLLPALRADAGAGRFRRAAPVFALAFLAGYSTLSAVTGVKRAPSALVGETHVLAALTAADRSAMQWVSTATPRSSRFLVVTGHGWEPGTVWAWGSRTGWQDDRVSEWFPVVAGRVSVATPQAYEWLPNGAFGRQVAAYESAQRCANREAACLDRWSAETGIAFTHVYLPKSPYRETHPDFECCQTLRASLAASAGYRRVYDGEGAEVFARVSPPPARSPS